MRQDALSGFLSPLQRGEDLPNGGMGRKKRSERGEGANAVPLPRSTDGAKAAAARPLLQRSLQPHTHTAPVCNVMYLPR
jgi:hypothetical protein